MKGNFSSLDPNSELFKRIEKDTPYWWKLFLEDDTLYIDIRKDNYINIYYLGSSIAKIKYTKRFVAEIHHKYLGIEKSDKTNLPVELETIDREKIADIKKKIEDTLNDCNSEHPAEKRMQGEMRNKNLNYIDSEFQYNLDPNIANLRIDLTEIKNGKLTFIELKGISDNRLRNDETRNPEKPEIVKQMSTYKSFLETYKVQIEDYYSKLIKIKNRLGILESIDEKIILNPIPKLIIANTYKKSTSGREERIEAIERLLTKEKIDFEIIKY